VAGFGLVGVALVLVMRLPFALAIIGAPLTAVIGASGCFSRWAGADLAGRRAAGVRPGRARQLARGLAAGAADAFGRGRPTSYGFAAGQLATLALLVRGVARAVPGPADERARLLPAFGEYRCSRCRRSRTTSPSGPTSSSSTSSRALHAAFYAAIAAVAWFSVIPAFAWIYVQVETAFYQRFRAFYADLESGAPLHQLKQGAELISDEARRILRGAAIVQAAASGVAIAAAPLVMRVVGLSPNATPLFRLAAIGAAMQVITLLVVLLLYYFDLRRDALMISTMLLAGEAALTLGCLSGGVAARDRLPGRLRRDIDARRAAGAPASGNAGLDTFQSQLFGVS
jgi:hypothetical protein